MNEKIQAWAMRLVLLIFTPIGVAATWLTWQYSSSGIDAQQLGEAVTAVRKLSNGVLMASHVGFIFVVALLPAKQFWAWRKALWVLAFAIWVFDGAGIYQARFGIMDRADSALTSDAQRITDQRAAIAGLHATAEGLRNSAPRLLANTRIKDATEAMKEAARLEARAAEMTAQLANMPTGVGSSEIKTWGGESGAKWRAIAEAALVSLILVSTVAISSMSLREVINSSKSPRPPMRPAPLDAPPRILRYPRRETGRVNLHETTPEQDDAPDAALEEIAPITLTQVQEEQKTKATKVRTVPAGLRAAIESGECKPSQGAIKVFTACGQTLAGVYLAQLEADGVIEKTTTGRYRLKRKQ